jgi:insecticidal toxin complex protein TccC
LGSCILELDEDGEVISQECYHPYGTTAWFAGRGEVEASYRTVRYSGKERDATGLYYYGFRYYLPWLQRWLNPDPAGMDDGLALFRFVRNSPLMNVERLS